MRITLFVTGSRVHADQNMRLSKKVALTKDDAKILRTLLMGIIIKIVQS